MGLHNAIILLILIVITFCSNTPNKPQTSNAIENKKIKTISPPNKNNELKNEKKIQNISPKLTPTITIIPKEKKIQKDSNKTPSLKKKENSQTKNSQKISKDKNLFKIL